MGRLKKHNTPEEKAEALREASKKYYWKNKEACDDRSRKNYKKRKCNQSQNLDTSIK